MGMYTDAAKRALLEAGGPLHIRKIVEAAAKYPSFKPRAKNVEASMWTCIYQEMRGDGEESPFVRLKGSVFDLRDRRADARPSPSSPTAPIRPVAGMRVFDENGNAVGIAREAGVAKDRGMVLIVQAPDGSDAIIEWGRIEKAGEIILLGPRGK